jgi:Ca2+-binding RTX toxin-like protein
MKRPQFPKARLLFGGMAASVIALVGAVVLSGSIAGRANAQAAIDPCGVSPPDGARSGTSLGDQLWGTSGDDVLYGLGGEDVLKGLGGNDTICGGGGNDAISGGPGNDVMGGGDGNDLIVGASENDTIYGGTNGPGIADALFGGTGNDTIIGTDDNGSGSAPDYINGGAGTDSIQAGANPTDEWWADSQPNSDLVGDHACPKHFGEEIPSARVGVWQPSRLVIQANDCVTATGVVSDLNDNGDGSGDGDRTFSLTTSGGTEYHVEFMPRDKPFFPGSGLDNGDTVKLRGLHVLDTNHPPGCTTNCEDEVHPVYWIYFVSGGGNASKCKTSATRCVSGPMHAGTQNLRPNNILTPPGQPGHRYCWNENGGFCDPWNPAGEPFN